MSATRAVRMPKLARHFGSLALIFLVASMFAADVPAYAAQAPVGLGTADSFAVLAGSGITNTGPTTITGDVGTFPTTSETGFGSVTLHGTNHGGDAVTQGAKNDLVTAYDDAFGRTPVTNVPVELGGSTLQAGVYKSPTFGLTGTLTLDAQGNTDAEFIFQAASTVIAESNSRVLLLNGADPCRVVWQVGSSATFKTGTQFVGDVLALTSITAQTAAVFQGRLLARNGAVTLDTNTITRANCIAPAGSGTTSTTVGTTPPTGGTATPFAPSGLTPGGGTGSPTATPVASLTPPAATPPGATPAGPPTATSSGPPIGTPGSPSAPPPIPRTGVEIGRLVATAFELLALGALAVVAAGRQQRLVLSERVSRK